ncbi:MAG: hypothetical protein U0931_05405 [Vulcanimicrobiota bacterium]
MDIKSVVQVLMTEIDPVEDEALTAVSQKHRETARALLADEGCLAAFILCRLAARFGASEVHINSENRKINLRFQEANIPPDFFQSEELLGWWWLLISGDCKAWMAMMRDGSVELLGWDGKKVFRNKGLAPEGVGATIEFQASLPPLRTPIFDRADDKQYLDRIREGFVERARVYPLPIYFNGVLWEWPLDIQLERVCSFTSYSLAEPGEVGFAVAHPWAHGCRYWMTRSGGLVDMVSKGAVDTQNASGNICHMPALQDRFDVQRRLNFLRKRDDPGIELSPVRGLWGKSSCLMGHEQYLLSPRTVVFGQTPIIRIQMRPLRVRQLLLQTDKVNEASVIVPVQDGMTLDPVFISSKPGGLHAWALAPEELVTARQGRKLAEKEIAMRWAQNLVDLCQNLQKPLFS